MLKFLDLPPIWLIVALASSWSIAQTLPFALFGWPGRVLGGICILAGLALMLLAVVQMMAQRTSFIPRRDPDALVTSGVFRLSRNPIYLGDVLVLCGAILWWDAVLAFVMVPLFMSLITKRFILDEEARLRRAFGPQFEAWSGRTNRWIGLAQTKTMEQV